MMALTRINNNISAINANRNLRTTSNDLSKSLERLSSGLRINRASDDAAGLTISENLRAQINGLNRAIDNASDAINLVNTAEGALIETTSRLQRIRVLAIQAANSGTNDSVALQAIQDEIETSIQEITRIAETTQFATRRLLNGEHQNRATVTGGTGLGVSVAPDPINSTLSTGSHFLEIVQTTAGSLTLTDGVDAIANSGATGLTGSTFDTGTYDLVLSNVRQSAAREVAVDIRVGDPTISPPTAATLVAGLDFTNGLGSTFTLGTTDEITFTGTENDGSAFTTTITVGAATTLGDIATILGTALGADSASYDASTGTFVITAATTGLTSTSVQFTVDDDGGGAPPELVAGQIIRTQGNDNDGVLTIGDGPAVTVVAGGTFTVLGRDPADPREPQPQITLTLGSTITGGTDALEIVQAAYSGQLDAGQTVNFQNGDKNVQFRSGTGGGFPSGETVTMDFNAVINLGTGTTRTFVISAVNESLNFQIGANAGQNVRIAFGDLSSNNLGFTDETQPNGNARVVSQINVTSVTGANEALAIVDEALRQVNSQRSALGAFTNRLEATINNLGVAAENLTASESRIRDADIAFETTRFTRNQILIQSGISILGQANLLPQNVLSLLG